MKPSVSLVAAAIVLAATASARAQSANPACQRLEAQLTALDRGNDDPTRADQIRRAEEGASRQQQQIDQMVAASRRMGCEGSGFFSIFNNAPPQCGQLSRQIGEQRSNLERIQNQLEQLHGGTTERLAQRRALLISLADNGCGPQYRSAALAGQQGGFFDRLFGNNNGGMFSSQSGSTFRTICVRACDGYYFPISFATTQDHFRDDDQVCQRTCPAAEVSLYSYHNPGDEVSQAVSLNGRLYTELPNAFRYRQAFNPQCSCRKPGESWAQALKANGNDDTLVPGDVVVTEQNAKQLSQPRIGADGKPIKPAARGVRTEAAAEPVEQTDTSKRTVRTIGPTFYPVR